MKRNLYRLLTLSIVLMVVCVSYTQTNSQTPADGQSKLVTEFEVNGLKVIVKRRPGAPTVSGGLFIKGGSANLTPKTAGLENLALMVAVEAGAKFPRAVVRKELARLGSSVAAAANRDFSVIALGSTRESFDRTWDIFTDTALNPSFTPEDLKLVRERVLTGIRNQSISPDSALDTLEQQVIYAGHPYSIDPLGTEETVNGFTVADLRAHHRKIVTTANMLLVMVGDIDPDAFRAKVSSAFGRLPKGQGSPTRVAPLTFTKGTLDIQPRQTETTYVKGVFAAPAVGDPDYHAMRVAIAILQGRVYQEVRIKRNLSYAPNSEMGDDAANTANIYVTSNDVNRAVQVMLAEIDSMKSEEIQEEEFLGIPGYFLTTYFVKQETNAAQIAELARYELIGGGWRNAAGFMRGISGVTPADVRRVAQKYMKNIRFVVVGNPESVDRGVFVR